MRSFVSVSEYIHDVLAHLSFLRSRAAVLIIGIMLILGIWVVDRNISEQVRFYALYLIPLSLIAWHCGQKYAVAASLLAVGLWVFGDPELQQKYDYSFIPFWNAFMRMATFLTVVLVVVKLRSAFDKERELARIDQVTGAPNRYYFVEKAEAELIRARRYNRTFAALYIDLDNFKLLNDRQGHEKGDEALRRTAEVIAANLREPDWFARIGGDEFAILLPETGADAACEVAQRISRKLLETAGQAGWPITFSIGVAGFRTPPDSVNELLYRADELMYQAKRAGKNRIKSRDFGSEIRQPVASGDIKSRTV